MPEGVRVSLEHALVLSTALVSSLSCLDSAAQMHSSDKYAWVIINKPYIYNLFSYQYLYSLGLLVLDLQRQTPSFAGLLLSHDRQQQLSMPKARLPCALAPLSSSWRFALHEKPSMHETKSQDSYNMEQVLAFLLSFKSFPFSNNPADEVHSLNIFTGYDVKLTCYYLDLRR